MKPLHQDPKADDLAKMYERSFSGTEYFKPGQVVETEVVSISKDCVFLQLNGKSEGILDRDELTDKEGKLTVKVGDRLRVFFLNAENGEMVSPPGSAGTWLGLRCWSRPILRRCRWKAWSKRKSRAATKSRSASSAPSAPTP